MRTPNLRIPGLGLLLALAFGACGGCNPGTNNNVDSDGGTPDAGDAGPDHPGVTLQSLTLSPADAVISTDGSTAAVQAYTVTGHYSDNSTADLTNQASFDVDNTQLGAFSGNVFNSGTTGGTTNVYAHVASLRGSTTLTVKLQRTYTDPSSGLSGDPSTAFSGTQVATGAVVPDIVYPNNGVMLPPNLSKLEIHFKPGTGNKLFELSFANAATDLKIYTRCNPVSTSAGSGCVYQPDSTVWRWLSETNRGGPAVNIGLRAVDDSTTGAQVGVSSTVAMSFAHDDVNGAIYYWTTSTTSIMRVAFGLSDAGVTQYISPSAAGGSSCIGCHALSRDGTKLVAEVQGQNDGRLYMVDIADGGTPLTPFPAGGTNTSYRSIFESWSPDGTQFVGVTDKSAVTSGSTHTTQTDFNLHIQDGVTGATSASVASTGTATNPADHPDWSPDGTMIAYTQVGVANTLQKFGLGSIKVVTKSGSSWAAPVTVVPGAPSKNHYYPAIAPDNGFLVYDESTCPASVPDGGAIAGSYYQDNSGNKTLGSEDCNADSDPTASLWAVTLDGGTPVKLAAANAPGKTDGANSALANSFPKWSPFITQGTTQGSKLMWVTFSSTRNFGLKANGSSSGSTENPTSQRIWMAAVDPAKLAAGQDPSFPAFYLPYQDPSTSNHIAQWAETLVTGTCHARNGTCTLDSDCCSGMFCYAFEGGTGTCQPSGTCANVGASCGGTVGCCSGLACLNSGGTACSANQSCTCASIIQ